MTAFFCDTSVLIKRYITEKGTNWIRSTLRPSSNHRIFIAQVTPIEMASALARRIRDGSITWRTGRAAQLYVERHIRREYTLMEITLDTQAEAVSLVYQHPLRAYDAVQLATALLINQRFAQRGLPQLVFLCADARLLNLANSIGLLTDNPENYP